MAEPKTKKTNESVSAFIDAVEHDGRREDAKKVLAMMKKVSGQKPAMWGPSIIGFGTYKVKSGKQENEWPRLGFSPRKANLVLYVMASFPGREALLAKLGKSKTSAACLYVNRLSDIEPAILEKLMAGAWAAMEEKYGPQ